ncbi:hypothetical protein BDK51DRAFT_44222 [Blyttiomyces helicus]|uniref:Uncharacterized protein n=1 Tax=Blyttiomyces helicus TaxID=388810 RepID=A0A4P9VTD4_9FUNG|nr:hypothetical protein BDK51DRAFT_44222 [Blyttiomyces helicus]|eukprot:RKO82781.1 hypothetical protein BDK51DRAFT_44222 [Blyttiomyces helicus]
MVVDRSDNKWATCRPPGRLERATRNGGWAGTTFSREHESARLRVTWTAYENDDINVLDGDVPSVVWYSDDVEAAGGLQVVVALADGDGDSPDGLGDFTESRLAGLRVDRDVPPVYPWVVGLGGGILQTVAVLGHDDVAWSRLVGVSGKGSLRLLNRVEGAAYGRLKLNMLKIMAADSWALRWVASLTSYRCIEPAVAVSVEPPVAVSTFKLVLHRLVPH